MVAAFTTPELRHVIERCVADAAVHENWPRFRQAAIRAQCVIVAFQEPGDEITEDRLGKLGAPGKPPLIIVTRPEGASLDLVGRVTCFHCIAVQEAELQLAAAVGEALGLSPRMQLAELLLRSLDHDGVSAAIVRAVLLTDEPVANIKQLADRLEFNGRKLRWEWDREARLLIDCTLHQFICQGRRQYAVEALGRGLSALEVAVVLDIDVSTVQRDLRTLGLQYGHSTVVTMK